MDFEMLTAQVKEPACLVYSVEKRSMLTHDTATDYFLVREEAIENAENLWCALDEQGRKDYEISVHQGHLEEQSSGNVRFIVQKKLFKAYKKVHVAERFSKRFLKERMAYYENEQNLASEEAKKLALKDFFAFYEIQSKVAYGMFADYDYEPKGIMQFAL